MSELLHLLPHVNASLNGLATVLLVVGYVLIKQRREIAHRNVMLGAFATSVVFLACYLVYHFTLYSVTGQRGKPFLATDPAVRSFYYFILITHIVLAATVPVLALGTIYTGLRDQRPRHRRWAWWTFPIWLYVSITGVLVYAMLYHLYPGPSAGQ